MKKLIVIGSLLVLFSCAGATFNGRTVQDVFQLYEHRTELDGSRITIDGYLYYADDTAEAPGFFYELNSAEQVEIPPGHSVNRCKGSPESNLLLLGMPRRFSALNNRRVRLSGTYHAEDRNILFSNMSAEFHSWVSDVRVERVYSDHCEEMPASPATR